MFKAVLAAALLALPVATSAATYQIDAASSNLKQQSDFSLIFDDQDNDMLFSLNELVYFSGVSLKTRGVVVPYTEIDVVPFVEFFADGSVDGAKWSFANATSNADANRSGWTYSITAIVPLPASVLMLVGALGGLGLLRRRGAIASING